MFIMTSSTATMIKISKATRTTTLMTTKATTTMITKATTTTTTTTTTTMTTTMTTEERREEAEEALIGRTFKPLLCEPPTIKPFLPCHLQTYG